MTATKDLSVSKLVKNYVQKEQRPNENQPPPQFLIRCVHHPDQKIAAQMVQKQAELEAEEIFGEEITNLKISKEDLEAQYEVSTAILNELLKRKAATYQYIKIGRET